MKYEKPEVKPVDFEAANQVALLGQSEDLQKPTISGESYGPRDPNHTN